MDLGRLKEALELADRAVARYPDDPHLLDTRGVILSTVGRLVDARRDSQKCLAVASEIPVTRARALLHLARVDLKEGEEASAQERLNEALALDREKNVFTRDEREEIGNMLNPPGG